MRTVVQEHTDEWEATVRKQLGEMAYMIQMSLCWLDKAWIKVVKGVPAHDKQRGSTGTL